MVRTPAAAKGLLRISVQFAIAVTNCRSRLSGHHERNRHLLQEIVGLVREGLHGRPAARLRPVGRYVMSQSTDDLTRSELRAIRGHYQRRVWLAFLIPALIAVALG